MPNQCQTIGQGLSLETSIHLWPMPRLAARVVMSHQSASSVVTKRRRLHLSSQLCLRRLTLLKRLVRFLHMLIPSSNLQLRRPVILSLRALRMVISGGSSPHHQQLCMLLRGGNSPHLVAKYYRALSLQYWIMRTMNVLRSRR